MVGRLYQCQDTLVVILSSIFANIEENLEAWQSVQGILNYFLHLHVGCTIISSYNERRHTRMTTKYFLIHQKLGIYI